MKHITGLLLTVLLVYSQTASPQDAYVLRSKGDRYSIARVSQKTASDVLTVGPVAVYGASERAIAVLSYKDAAKGYILDVVDLSTGIAAASWPVDADPLMQLSGPSRDIVLSDAFAYFLTIKHGDAIPSFHFNQLSLADGSIRTLPLPARFATPRLTDFEGTPLLYTWNGFGVARFDPLTQQFEELVSRVDVGELASKEETGRRSGKISASAFADHVAVSGAGVFRLSKFGDLHQVLNPDLSPVDGDRSIPLGSAENIRRLFATTSDDRPAIGVVRQVNGRLQLVCIDAERLSVMWEKALPRDVAPQSVVGSMYNAAFFVDRSEGSIKMISKRSEKTMSRIPAAQATGTRILVVSGSG